MLDSFETKTDFCVVTGEQHALRPFNTHTSPTTPSSISAIVLITASTAITAVISGSNELNGWPPPLAELGQGELFEVLENDLRMPEALCQKIAKQLVQALHYLHSMRIIHRDVRHGLHPVGTAGRQCLLCLPGRSLGLIGRDLPSETSIACLNVPVGLKVVGSAAKQQTLLDHAHPAGTHRERSSEADHLHARSKCHVACAPDVRVRVDCSSSPRTS